LNLVLTRLTLNIASASLSDLIGKQFSAVKRQSFEFQFTPDQDLVRP
jgi:hypothetical protein